MIELNKILTAQTNVSGLTGKTNPPQKNLPRNGNTTIY